MVVLLVGSALPGRLSDGYKMGARWKYMPSVKNGASLIKAISKESSSKYRNKKTEADGFVFDSKHEYYRWVELKYMERAGLIYELQRQVPFVLIPTQRSDDGKVIEREVKYIADFTYRRKSDNRLVVEDAKSKATKTDVYKIKRKLMLYRNGIRIQEV